MLTFNPLSKTLPVENPIYSEKEKKNKPSITPSYPSIEEQIFLELKQEITESIVTPVVEKTNKLFHSIIDIKVKSPTIMTRIGSFFGHYLHVDEIGYLNRSELTHYVITHLTGQKDVAEKLKNYPIIQNKISHIILKHGLHAVQALIEHLDKSRFHCIKYTSHLDILRALDHLDHIELPEIEWSTNILDDIQHLQPGDLIFFQNIGSYTSPADICVMTGQKVAQLWIKGPLEFQAETFTHMAIYLGEGKFAEAQNTLSGEDVRILSFDDPSMHLDAKSGWQYLISRPQDPQIASHAAAIALRYAEDKSAVKKSALEEIKDPALSLITKLRYSPRKAAQSLLGDSSFTLEAKKQTLAKLLQLSHDLDIPLDEHGSKQDFFCSFLVMDCLQRGNLLHLMEEIKNKVGEKFPKLTTDQVEENKKIMSQWALSVLNKHPDILDGLLIQFDPKYISPQKFRTIVGSHPHLFKDILRIVPQKELNF